MQNWTFFLQFSVSKHYLILRTSPFHSLCVTRPCSHVVTLWHLKLNAYHNNNSTLFPFPTPQCLSPIPCRLRDYVHAAGWTEGGAECNATCRRLWVSWVLLWRWSTLCAASGRICFLAPWTLARVAVDLRTVRRNDCLRRRVFCVHSIQCQCQWNVYIAPIIEGRIWGAGVSVTRHDRQKRKGEI